MLRQQADNQVKRAESFLVFEVAGRLFALPTSDITQVLPMATLSGGPGPVSILAGFLNLTGDAIPIVYLSRILELPEPPLDASLRLIVVRHAGHRYGLITNKVLHVAAASAEVVPLPGMAVAKTAVRIGAAVAPVIGVDGLVLEQEQRLIAELREAHARRLAGLEEPRLEQGVAA